jgi:hypothetical protein
MVRWAEELEDDDNDLMGNNNSAGVEKGKKKTSYIACQSRSVANLIIYYFSQSTGSQSSQSV